MVEFSTPDFISYAEFYQTIPNDTYFSNQVTCHNTGQTFNDGHSGTNDADIDAPEAWEMTTGSNDVIIAVLDQGVTSNHPDLPNTRQVRLNGSDFTSDDDNPSPVGNENHGNACAGVIAATMNNNQGIAGIAPACRIMPIRMSDVGPSVVADAIEFAVDNGADILSNSWGWGTTDPNRYPEVVTAINYAISNNRVVIFAAGNSADHDDNYDGYVGFPANVEITGVITVGASDRYDHQANYSPTSDPESEDNQIIDIVAPSNRSMPWQDIEGETYEMWTIDIPGNAGYNPWHGPDTPPNINEVLPNSGTNYLYYTGRFGGTSHSCPVVAGVAALVLSANQDLTYMDVFNILTATADEVGGYTYTNGWSDELGYGRVNACGAVFEAFSRIMYVTGPSLVCASNSTFTLHNRPSGTTVNWTKSSNLQPVSGQGTNNYTVKAYSFASGTGWVQATINSTSCGSVTLPPYSVWAGTPQITNKKVDGGYYYPGMQICPGDHALNVTPVGGDAGTATWTVPPGIIYFVGINELDFTFPFDASSVAITTRSTNTCGTGPNSSFYLTKKYYGCGRSYGMTLYPNPASDYVTITMIEILPLVEYSDSSINNMAITDAKADEPTTYTIRIYNSQSILLSTWTRSGKSFNVPLINIRDGTYIIEVSDGKNIYRQQLFVKHN